MSTSIVPYDRALPEVRDRRPWEKPTSHLVKADGAVGAWREDRSGRRPSQLLLVPNIRQAVDAWREDGYRGASEVAERLFNYWFEEHHEVRGYDAPFRYHFCQREAIETLVWLVEIAGHRDTAALVEAHATAARRDLATAVIEFETGMDGRQRLRRHSSEPGISRVQDLPPEDLRRFAFKMATGSGKTWVMAMAVVWSHFHKLAMPDSELSTNFLILAPNVIVYQRLERDFADNRIFHELPLIPPEWRKAFSQKVILRGDVADPDASRNLFLTNIHQLYDLQSDEWRPGNAVEAMLGEPPPPDSAGRSSMLERIMSVDDLLVINDEAHHVHDEALAWSRTLLSIHRKLPEGLAAWLDFSATPRDQDGLYFPWTVCDYPLAQAVEDRIVKAPLIVSEGGDPARPVADPSEVTGGNAAEKYGFWLEAAVRRWREHCKIYERLGRRPVLFVVTEKNNHADALGRHLWSNSEFGLTEGNVLVIHTDTTGEVRRGDIEKARRAARDIDRPDNRIKVVVSVMMLREGWDVRNVTVVLGLRPFTARAEILPEQIVGRGLRPMTEISPDRTQTLEVLGTPKLLEILREQLEAEGVGSASVKTPPAPPTVVEPLMERLGYDIAIPVVKPSLHRDMRKISELRPESLAAIFDREELAEPFRIKLKLEFATLETEVHQDDVFIEPPPARENLARITRGVSEGVGLPAGFAALYPVVRDYVRDRCFGKVVDLDDKHLRSHLNRLELREGVAEYLVREIARIAVERRTIEFDRADFRLSETKPFAWRRNLPLPRATKTVFNFVATYNGFERQFAEFLDRATDVSRFAALGTTEQGASGTSFRVDYLKPSGAIGFYYPDWIAIQEADGGETNWIIETKGRVWEGTAEKDAAMREWCRRVGAATGARWRYIRVNQTEFRPECETLRALVVGLVSGAMFAERDRRDTVMSRDEVRAARDDGRA